MTVKNERWVQLTLKSGRRRSAAKKALEIVGWLTAILLFAYASRAVFT